MRLLVVEDEKSLRDDITKKLRLDGYEADACGDGNEARELLAGILMICFGIWRGEAETVLSKAIRLCMECVGIG